MTATIDVAEYLAEIRDQVCSRCVERPAGGPPCAPLGKNCGLELHLSNLINSIHEVHSPWMAAYLDHNRHEICEQCAFLHSSICPCPMDYLAALAVEAVETVDRRHDRAIAEAEISEERIRPTLEVMEAIRDAFIQGAGTWARCDWPTHFGKHGLNLNGLTPIEAQAMAERAGSSALAADWQAAIKFLQQVEHHAAQAEANAASAVRAAGAGDWPAARRHAERAWILEFTTGRPMRRFDPPTWQHLRQLVVDAARLHAEERREEEMQAQD